VYLFCYLDSYYCVARRIKLSRSHASIFSNHFTWKQYFNLYESFHMETVLQSIQIISHGNSTSTYSNHFKRKIISHGNSTLTYLNHFTWKQYVKLFESFHMQTVLQTIRIISHGKSFHMETVISHGKAFHMESVGQPI